MKKVVFTLEEAQTVAYDTKPATLKLELHLWKKTGEIISVKRGVYAFAGTTPNNRDIISALYPFSYISLESALSSFGIIPDVPFKITAVTTRPSKTFTTPWGVVSFRQIAKRAFNGYDPKMLIAEKEKAVVDYLFLRRNRLLPSVAFWKEQRWQNLKGFNFKKAGKYSMYFNSKKILGLLKGLEKYATTAHAD